MAKHIFRGLPHDYQEANGYSTDAAYRDGHRGFNQQCTEAIIGMTFREMRAAETVPNAESRDIKICICNVQSGFLRAEACYYRGEYDHLQ
jgi:hypothetical protein